MKIWGPEGESMPAPCLRLRPWGDGHVVRMEGASAPDLIVVTMSRDLIQLSTPHACLPACLLG